MEIIHTSSAWMGEKTHGTTEMLQQVLQGDCAYNLNTNRRTGPTCNPAVRKTHGTTEMLQQVLLGDCAYNLNTNRRTALTCNPAVRCSLCLAGPRVLSQSASTQAEKAQYTCSHTDNNVWQNVKAEIDFNYSIYEVCSLKSETPLSCHCALNIMVNK